MKKFFLLFMMLCATPSFSAWKDLGSVEGAKLALCIFLSVDYLRYAYKEFQRPIHTKVTKLYCAVGATADVVCLGLVVMEIKRVVE